MFGARQDFVEKIGVIVETQIKNTLSLKVDAHGKYALCWSGCPQKNHCSLCETDGWKGKVAHRQMLEAITELCIIRPSPFFLLFPSLFSPFYRYKSILLKIHQIIPG